MLNAWLYVRVINFHIIIIIIIYFFMFFKIFFLLLLLILLSPDSVSNMMDSWQYDSSSNLNGIYQSQVESGTASDLTIVHV